jgi:hypothetical protein
MPSVQSITQRLAKSWSNQGMIVIYEKYRIRHSIHLACVKVISNGATHDWSDWWALSCDEMDRVDQILRKVLAGLRSQ